jgi:hypothetical protein
VGAAETAGSVPDQKADKGASEEPDEGPAGRLLRLLLVGTIVAVALKLLPSIGMGAILAGHYHLLSWFSCLVVDEDRAAAKGARQSP